MSSGFHLSSPLFDISAKSIVVCMDGEVCEALGGQETFSDIQYRAIHDRVSKFAFPSLPDLIIINSTSHNNMIWFRSLTPFSTSVIKSQGEMMRLSKWISYKSVCSRKEAENIVKLGLVRIDGQRVFENMMIPYEAQIKAHTPTGLKVEKPITKLWMMNKPRGYICTKRDNENRPTIYTLIPPSFSQLGHIMSVGRLDFNSEGLLLLTNDTSLKNLLENPTTQLPRFYRVKVHGRVTEDKLVKMNNPVIINQVQYGPLKASIDRSLSTNSWLNVELMGGKNREIRRIMQKCDLQVNKLKRQSYGPYKLGSLKHGEIMEVEISKGLERKIKKHKAEEIVRKSSCLVEIDIRPSSIQYALDEQRKEQIKEQLQKKE